VVPVGAEPASWSLLSRVGRTGSPGWCSTRGEGSKLEGAPGGAVLAAGLQRTCSLHLLTA